MRNQVLLVAAMVCFLGGGVTDVGAQFPKKPLVLTQPPEVFKPKPAPPMLMRWEYQTVPAHKFYDGRKFDDSGLNKLGAEGWELIAIDPPQSNQTSLYVFRRPAVGQPKPAAKPAPEPAPKEKAETKLDLQTIPLKFADAIALANLIEEALQLNNYPMRIVPDQRTNQLIVNGSIEAQIAVKGLVERLDQPSRNEPAQTAPRPPIVLPGKKKAPPSLP